MQTPLSDFTGLLGQMVLHLTTQLAVLGGSADTILG